MIFFSAAYLSAAAFTIGLMICSSAWYQSLENSHLLPFHVWIRAQLAPMWSAHEVETGRSTPLKPNASNLGWVRFRFS